MVSRGRTDRRASVKKQELLAKISEIWDDDPAGVPIYIAVINAVRQARRDGRHKHDPESWVEQSVEEQLHHMLHHAVDYSHGTYLGVGNQRQDIEHLVCRGGILLAMLDLFKGGFTRAEHGMPNERGPGLDDSGGGGQVP